MSERIRLLYLLSPGEQEVPPVVREATDAVSMRAHGTPDLTTLDEPPQVILIGAPLGEDLTRELKLLRRLELPIVGFGTGPSENLAAHVSRDVGAEDLAVVLQLVRLQSDFHNLDLLSTEHPAAGRWLESVTDGVTQMIQHLMTLRLPEYKLRTDRVVRACDWIGQRLGMHSEDLRVLLMAARLREIGKLGLPDRILFSPRTTRTPEEQKLYDHYPALGAKVMRELDSLKEAARILECQLENFDGSGPAGLASHQIPLASRILRVASAFEMILHDSPDSATTDEIMSVLERGMGSMYDPLLVKLVQNYHILADASGDPRQRTRRIRLSDIAEGMVLAEDVWSRTGMKIVPRGTKVSEAVMRLMQSSPVDPAVESIEIYTASIPAQEGKTS